MNSTFGNENSIPDTYATDFSLSRSILDALMKKYYIIFGKIRENQPKNYSTPRRHYFFSCSSGAVEAKLTQVWEEKQASLRVYGKRTKWRNKNYNREARKTSFDHMASE